MGQGSGSTAHQARSRQSDFDQNPLILGSDPVRANSGSLVPACTESRNLYKVSHVSVIASRPIHLPTSWDTPTRHLLSRPRARLASRARPLGSGAAPGKPQARGPDAAGGLRHKAAGVFVFLGVNSPAWNGCENG